MARDWTHQQLQAINTRDKSLFVSAAAGSGKTATLTERVIASILDDENPTDINRLLVVTFTKAAVGELRDRISVAIKEKLASMPDNQRLQKQLYLLPGAKIMTIDSFCNYCLKTFPDAAGINPGYRIADEAEIMIAARDIFDGLSEAIMRGELEDAVKAEEFDALTDCLVDTKRMAEIFDVLRVIYTRLLTTRDGIGTLHKMVEEYNPEAISAPEGTAFGAEILRYVKESFAYRAELSLALAGELWQEGEESEKYAECAQNDAISYTRIAKIDTYSDMRAALEGFSLSQIPRVANDKKTPLMLLFKSARDKEKDRLKTEKDKFFTYTPEEWGVAYGKLYPLLSTLYRVLSLFDVALSDFKKKRGIFDYTDIERLCYGALIKDGEPTDIAKSLRADFSAVYIDEYQDVNDLQDSIFRAISRPDNRFAVGDIKQSIYGFRSANPEIFANAKRAYPSLETVGDAPAASLFMSKNFRSSAGVIDFVNLIFDKVFLAFKDSIDYSSADRLEVGRKPLGESFDIAPEICICPRTEASYDAEDDEVFDDEENEGVLPLIVAQKIREILDTGRREDGSKVKPCDIAVILRSMKGRSEKYTDAMKKLGIPVKTSGKKDFFLNSGVLLALCLLNTIDNPLRDVYLTGLLRSPVFDFTADELLKIRTYAPRGAFYHSLVAFVTDHPDFKKGADFLSRLSAWREIGEGMRADRLINRLFNETGLYALAEEAGEKNNLIRLYEYARSFEGTGFGGLGGFIGYINSVIADGEKFNCNIESTEADAVTVISAHSSKGLEYPIVFYADAHRRIQCPDLRNSFYLVPTFGASMRYRTPLGLAMVDNPMMNITAEKIKRANLEEELRILYVALTRARERLFVVGSYSEYTKEEYLEKMHLYSLVPTAAGFSRLSSHLDMVLAATKAEPTPVEKFIKVTPKIAKMIGEVEEQKRQGGQGAEEKTPEKLDTPPTQEAKSGENGKNCTPIDKAALLEELKARFNYEYHSPHLNGLPEKMSVSALYPAVLDGNEESFAPPKEENDAHKTVPEFISPDSLAKSRRRGIATHLFMQFFDIKGLEELDAAGELERLEKEHFISKAEAELVRLDEIRKFRSSELFSRMKGAKRLLREFRFNTALPATLFSQDAEKKAAIGERKILVQGVIDCIMENPDGTVTVIDYKTDRLTKAELENPALAEEKLRRAHSVQLGYYSLAVEQIFGKKPSSIEVYSLHLGRCVKI